MKTAPLALFCLNLFSFARIQSGGHNEKGSQAARAAEAALVFLADLTVNRR